MKPKEIWIDGRDLHIIDQNGVHLICEDIEFIGFKSYYPPNEAVEVEEIKTSLDVPYGIDGTGTFCPDCGNAQYRCPNGITCAMGKKNEKTSDIRTQRMG
jgi:hypothetical protein